MNSIFNRLYHALKFWVNLERKVAETKILSAQPIILLNNQKSSIQSLAEVEFKVFSQFGDDGIIQYLIHKLPHLNKTFVEFGVEDYREANTRFLLMNNNWEGLILDGSPKHINSIRQDYIYYLYNLKARNSFITAENINQLLTEEGFTGELGILHIDIDGNDYWVWNAINVVNPAIVIMEYNALFGCDRPITTPYQADFYRTKAHYSNLYFGSSLKALCILAEQKGYDFIGCCDNGANAYFVRKDVLSQTDFIKPKTCEEGFVMSRFRQSRDAKGKLTFLSNEQGIQLMKGLPVWDVEKGTIEAF